METQRDDLARTTAAVQLKARELEQASQYKSDFLANMSHELRTPLNSSLILAKLLADNPDDNLTDEQVKFARTIQSSGNDLLNLINDILDLSKIEAGPCRDHARTRCRSSGWPRICGRSSSRSRRRRAWRSRSTSPPECPATIETDVQRLEQVLKNLLSNAFKFTETGQGRTGDPRSGDGQIALSVTDTGIGISEEQQQSVFEAFRQADGTISRKYGGTGLGLSISRELVRLLGGSIRLQQPRGRRQHVHDHHSRNRTIRRRCRRASRASASPPIPSSNGRWPRLPRRRACAKVEDDRDALTDTKRVLLVVEDDETFAGILRDLSREMGFQSPGRRHRRGGA